MTVIVAGLMAALTMLHSPHVARSAPQRASRGAQRTHAVPSPCGGWRELVGRYEWNVDDACRRLMCESGGRADARNGRYHSLFQVDGGSFDPAINVAQAFALYSRRGWQPWTCR